MSKVTQLASSQINTSDTLTVELVETDTAPAVVIIIWPDKATVMHPRRFPETAATLARLFATASTELSRIKSRRKL